MTIVTLQHIRTPKTGAMQFELESFQIKEQEHWAIIGGNGSGKTLLANIVSGKQVLSRGQRDYAPDLNPAKDILIVSFEEQQSLFAHDTRFDDSEMRADAYDKGTTVAALLAQTGALEGDIDDVCQLLDLKKLSDSGIRFLSTGEMRKTLIARALLKKPRLLILDNPLSGLDKNMQADFAVLLTRLMTCSDSVMLLLGSDQAIPGGITHVLQLKQCRVIYQGNLDYMPAYTDDVFKAGMQQMLPRYYEDKGARQRYSTTDFVRLVDVEVAYSGQQILRDVSWTYGWGQHCVVAGPNGCGKSTLLSLLNGDNPKAYGQNISLFGHAKGSGESIWDLKQRFGVVSMALHNAYVRGYTSIDVVMSGFQDSIGLYGAVGDKQLELAKQWLAVVGMSEYASQRYEQLSFGQQRMVLLARAMVKNPLILILDEPCIGLDTHNKSVFLALIDRIACDTNTHILFVSHVADERPACINQHLQFAPHKEGGFTAHVEVVAAKTA